MKKNERQWLTRLALVLAIILLIVAFVGLQQQTQRAGEAAQRMLDNLPPVATVVGE